MQTLAYYGQAFRDGLKGSRVKLVGITAGGASLAAAAMAGNLSDSLAPVIGDVTDLIPLLYAMIIAFVPLIILMLIIDFFTGIFGGLLGRFKV